jgi:hypothetical protein
MYRATPVNIIRRGATADSTTKATRRGWLAGSFMTTSGELEAGNPVLYLPLRNRNGIRQLRNEI